jgi:hypothetical protein
LCISTAKDAIIIWTIFNNIFIIFIHSFFIQNLHLLKGWPQWLWGHAFIFRLTGTAAGNIKLLLHQQKVHSFQNRPVKTSSHRSYSFCIYGPEKLSLQLDVGQLNARRTI